MNVIDPAGAIIIAPGLVLYNYIVLSLLKTYFHFKAFLWCNYDFFMI